MKIELLCVGRLSAETTPLCEHYLALLRPYASVRVREVRGVPLDLGPERVVKEEGEALLRLIRRDWVTVALEREGAQFTSPELAAWLADQKVHGAGHFQFILGGALGLDARIKAAASLVWSLSSLTFPHQLARCLVLEQIYRAFRIERGEPYHY